MTTTAFENVLPQVSEYLHLVDSSIVAMASRKLKALMERLMHMQGGFRSLAIHGLESTDCFLDLRLSNFLFSSRLNENSFILLFMNDKFENAQELFLYNMEEAAEDLPVLPRCIERMKKLSTLVLCNVTKLSHLSAFESIPLLSLKIGFNQVRSVSMNTAAFLNLPNLKTLEITGFDPNEENISWLLSLLKSIKALRWLRLNCEAVYEELVDSAFLTDIDWNKDELFYLDLVEPKSIRRTIQDEKKFNSFTNLVLGDFPSLPHLHTVTLNRSPTASVWNSLTNCKNLMHVVLSGIDPSLVALKQLGALLKNNCESLQILLLKFAGRSPFHFDSFLQLILNCGNIPLERFELEVEMNHITAHMETPIHSIKAAATLRCRYKKNMYFKRSKFGIAMGFHRLVCSDSADSDRSITSPMELFCEEMIRGMYETDDQSSAQIEADMINEWNKVGQIQRNVYVEIFDEYMDKELLGSEEIPFGKEDYSGESGYCDVAATIANLRE